MSEIELWDELNNMKSDEDKQRFAAHFNRETTEQLAERLGKEPEVIFTLTQQEEPRMTATEIMDQNAFENWWVEEGMLLEPSLKRQFNRCFIAACAYRDAKAND